MERLTKATDDLSFLCNHLRRETKFNAQRVKDIHDRLAAYEDTGMEPEEIKLMKEREEWQPFEKITSAFGVPLDRICELAEADKDGRCVALPCKVGDMVYVVDTVNGITDVYERHITAIMCNGWDGEFFVKLGLFGSYRIADFGKTVFLTREAAEAALKAGEPR